MRLIINRRLNGAKSAIMCRVQLTEEEQQLVDRYDLGGIKLFMSLHKLTDFIRGVTTTELTSVSGTLFYEDHLIEEFDRISDLLDRCRSFNDELVVQYPREDRTIDVRVKNTVRTTS